MRLGEAIYAMRLRSTARAPRNRPNASRIIAGPLQGHGIASHTRMSKLGERSCGDQPRWHSSFLQPALAVLAMA